MQEGNPIPSHIPSSAAEEILGLFHILGTEMQGIPTRYRNEVFTKLQNRAISCGGPSSITGLVTTAFMDGWLDYP